MAEENASNKNSEASDFGNASDTSGLVHIILQLAGKFVGVLQTRLEILVTEIEEARLQFGQLLLLSMVAAFCLGVCVVLLAVLVAVLFWDTHRLAALGVMAGFFLAAGVFALMLLRGKLANNNKMFAATLAELAKDREHLK